MTAFAREPGFCNVLLGAPGVAPVLEAVEAQGVLEPPYQPPGLRRARESSSFLLHPRHEVVPFRGRDQELAELREWCAGEPGLDVALLTGPGGSGKTRLARQLCRRLAEDNEWITGPLVHSAPAAQLASLACLDTPVLIVVDYAETRRDQRVELLEQCATVQAPDHQLRVLVLARQRGDRWAELGRARRSPNLRRALGSAYERQLAPAEGGVSGRRAAYEEALAAFAMHTGPATKPATAPNLSSPYSTRCSSFTWRH